MSDNPTPQPKPQGQEPEVSQPVAGNMPQGTEAQRNQREAEREAEKAQRQAEKEARKAAGEEVDDDEEGQA